MKTSRKRAPHRPLLRNINLRDRIYAELRMRVQHSMSEEDRLVDNEIAEEFGTSRMPVRDALLRLVNEGYLVGTTRGFVAPRLSLQDVREIFEVRRMLEPEAIANAATNMTLETAAALTAALQHAREAAMNKDGSAFMMASIQFREAWLGCVSNERLAGLIARFVDHVQTVRNSTLKDPEVRDVVIEMTTELYNALVERDAARARAGMVKFLQSGEQYFFQAWEKGGCLTQAVQYEESTDNLGQSNS